jgi:hypothetical protein
MTDDHSYSRGILPSSVGRTAAQRPGMRGAPQHVGCQVDLAVTRQVGPPQPGRTRRTPPVPREPAARLPSGADHGGLAGLLRGWARSWVGAVAARRGGWRTSPCGSFAAPTPAHPIPLCTLDALIQRFQLLRSATATVVLVVPSPSPLCVPCPARGWQDAARPRQGACAPGPPPLPESVTRSPLALPRARAPPVRTGLALRPQCCPQHSPSHVQADGRPLHGMRRLTPRCRCGLS